MVSIYMQNFYRKDIAEGIWGTVLSLGKIYIEVF